MKKHILPLILALALMLTACGAAGDGAQTYTVSFLDLFDTVTTVVGRAESQEDFTRITDAIREELARYHRLFDVYNTYDTPNLKTVNDSAGVAPVAVDGDILRLLKDCADYYSLTGGRLNVAMGSVLALWHDAREAAMAEPLEARLPDAAALAEAAKHCAWDTVVIDETAGTVFLTDPAQRLDVGAVAKGWATQRVAENAPEGLLISVGGNVCATGAKTESGTPWVVGIADPDGGSDYLSKLDIVSGSVVTSGDYQRCYSVDGKIYHHIIDPDTLYPGTQWRAVTIVCEDSGLADALSTALFLLPREEGQKLLDATGAQALWIDAQGQMFYSPGFEALIRA